LSDKLNISTDVLYEAAHAVRHIADDWPGNVKPAVNDTDDSTTSLSHWHVAPVLVDLAATWRTELGGLGNRLSQSASNLRTTAETHESNEQALKQSFTGQ
jgi:hypothetical protein